MSKSNALVIDHATLLGVLSAFGLVFLAILAGGGFTLFFDFRSLLIVLGGTFGGTLMNYSLDDLTRALDGVKNAFFLRETTSANERIVALLQLSERARTEGLLSLEASAEREPDPFLQKGLQLVVDGFEASEVERTLQIELGALRDHHKRGSEIFETMASISPAMGLIGTLIGLVQMLRDLNSPEAIGPGMALALITTFYGALLAHLVFFPLAGKLRLRADEELLLYDITIEGLLELAKNTNPKVLETRLRSFIPRESNALLAHERWRDS